MDFGFRVWDLRFGIQGLGHVVGESCPKGPLDFPWCNTVFPMKGPQFEGHPCFTAVQSMHVGPERVRARFL